MTAGIMKTSRSRPPIPVARRTSSPRWPTRWAASSPTWTRASACATSPTRACRLARAARRRQAVGKTLCRAVRPADLLAVRRSGPGARWPARTCTTSARDAPGDGSLVWISVNLRPHRGRRRQVVLGYFSCALEVQELKRTHDALSPRAAASREPHREHAARGDRVVVEHRGDALVAAGRRRSSAGRPRKCSGRKSERDRARPRRLARDRARAHEGAARRAWCRATACLRATTPRTAARSGASGTTRRSSTSRASIASILSLAEDVTARVDAEEQLQEGRGARRAHRIAQSQLARRAPRARDHCA